ncbi:septal ring lytic transglycosylase RlpA family protein [Microvirga thermotolerans]|uniref:septal ring lytic transglycosylase RlpA family protein n=1 Tax=Microvirga thermotolerans TaxID=2651334 RepID=UPI0018844DC0|nr:septal ring lytic transglycosylase RlpA family protein [Microvirga thermotolerans]
MDCDRAEAKAGAQGCATFFNHRTVLRIAGVAAIALTAANCSNRSGIDPKYGVAPSPRVVADGQPVPKGGGQRMVGKPYVVAGRTYVPRENPSYSGEGLASWYGASFHGRRTANGEVFDRVSVAAAHTTMPLPSYARVTNLQNGHSMIVRVNDRGPFHGNRIIDVSERAALALGFKHAGTARVRVEYVGPASTNGSDDRILLASLRTDGTPASLNRVGPTPTMIASATPRPAAPAASLERAAPSDGVATALASATDTPQKMAFAGSPARGIPLPPERPFDLGTIPGAATPVAVSSLSPSVVPPSRPVVAGLYYAPETVRSGFQKSDGFRTLDRSRFLR